MESCLARMDIRGFVRFPKEFAAKWKLKSTPFADVFIDKVGGRIAIVPTTKIKTNSFRILPSNETFLLYLRGAMKAVGMEVVSGPCTLTKDGDKWILAKSPSKKSGGWELFACRNSAGIPMVSIDPRGTLTLDKRCISAIDTEHNPTTTPEYDAKKKTFTFTFGKKGLLNVRTFGSHASLSMMGTLHAFGVKIPEAHTRIRAEISGKVLTFKLG